MAASSGDCPAAGPRDGPLFTKMEFAVRMTCQSCVDAVKKSLENVGASDVTSGSVLGDRFCVSRKGGTGGGGWVHTKGANTMSLAMERARGGVRSVYVSLEEEVVLVETNLPSATVQGYLEATGRLVVFRGYGGTGQQASSSLHHGAAVVILHGEGGVGGLVRMVQVTPERCVVEGTVDGLTAGQHDIRVHQFGDLSEGCESCGDVYTTPDSALAGHLVSVVANSTGRATFQVVSEHLKVWDIIGRSIVVHSLTHSQSSSQPGSRVMCGIIARSAGLFQNTKKVCTCDGVTIWDEAEKVQQTDLRAAL